MVGTRSGLRGGLLAATALGALVGWGVLSFTAPAVAQVPTGGKVVGGSATITTAPSQVTVNQSSSRGVIDWQSFSIGQGSRVDFQQPGASAVTLNRVTGPDPSVIAGQLTANGQIVLVNGAGVFFANGAQVNVGALVASTANISDAKRFMAGGPVTFDVASPNANAGVVNNGSITVRDGGLVGLVGNMAANNGTINARLGRVTIGGAETFTVDLAGDGLINFQLGQPVSRQPTDAQGRKVALASNTGTINADGGVVQMTARAAGSVVDNVVNVGGAIRAQAVSQEGGVLVLGGEGATVNVTGTLDVSGKTVGQRGGQVIATASGGKVNVASTAVIDASGASGGGRVNIGGSYQGKGPVANARDTTVETGARINADATRLGNGGTVIVWSDNATVFGGTISAKGGLKGGDGGFAEVSGKQHLDYHGFTDLRAPLGTVGTLLLDPSDITIQAAGTNDTSATGGDPNTITGNSAASILTVTTLQNALANANVVVDAAGGTGTSLLGSITVADAVSIPNGRTLTLTAPGSIAINAPVSTPGDANLVITTTQFGSITNAATGVISLGNGTLTLNSTGGINLGAASVTAGTVNFTSQNGSVIINAPGNLIGAVSGTATTAGQANIQIVSGKSLTVANVSASGSSTAGGSLVSITTSGVLSINGDITSDIVSLTATSGTNTSIVQGGGNIVANKLQASASGAVQLTSPTNDVTFIAGSAGTSFRYVDGNDVSLGIGNVVNVGSGTIASVQGITVGAGGFVDIAADQIAITRETGTLSGPVTGRVGTMFFGEGIVDNPTGSVVFRPLTAGTPMVIGGTTGTTLTQDALIAGIAAGTLRIGSIGRAAGTVLGGATTAQESAAGAVTVQQLNLNLFGSGVSTLVLETGAGSITQTGFLRVGALATATLGGGSVTLTNATNAANTISHVARINDTALGIQSGAYQFTGSNTVTVGTIGSGPQPLPLVGLRDGFFMTGGSVELTSTSIGTIIVSSPLIAINTVVTLSDPGAIFNTAGGTIDVGSGGTLNLNSGSSINLSAAPVVAGVINFTADFDVTITNPGNAIDTIGSVLSVANFGQIQIFSTKSLTVASGGLRSQGSTAGVTLSSSGLLTINGDVQAPTGQVTLIGSGGILQTAGTISAPIVDLDSSAGDIVQEGGNIVASGGPGFTASLTATASGSVDLASATNDVVTLVGAAGGDFRYVDANTVSIGQVSTFPIGITIGAGRYLDIAANTIDILPGARIGGIAAGTQPADNPTGVTVLRPTTAGTAMVVGGAGGTTGTLMTESGLIGAVRTGTLRLGSIGRAAGTVLGGATTAQESATGAITIQGLDLITSSFGTSVIETLVLESAATGTAIGQTAPLRVGHLATAVLGSGGVELTQDNSVAGIAHIARISDTALGTQSGTFRYVDGTFIPVVTTGGSGTRLIGQRDTGDTQGAPPNSAIFTTGGDVTLVSRTSGIQFINGLAAVGATVRLSAPGDIFQDATGGVVANALLARAGSVNLTTAAGLNNVRFISGIATGGSETLGDFRLINNASVTVPAGGVAGDSLVATVDGAHAGFGATLELAIRTGDITASNTTLTAADGLVLLRRVAGATGSEIILDNVSFDSGSGSPNLVVLDLTGSPALVPGNFDALKSSVTPPNGTSAIPIGPNPDGGILLTNVNAGDTTMYLVGGPGATVGGSGTFGLLGVYVAHSNPIALTGSVRQVDPTQPHSVTASFGEPFDATTFAGFYVRRRGAVVDVQTFNECPIGSGICPTPPPPPEEEIEIPPTVQRPPDDPGRLVGVPQQPLVINFATDRSPPTPLGLSSVILVNQGNEYFFNIDEERRKQRAARGGQ
ncbi:beta strand repeat-containing protein [Vineibacter terrae]|uniref:beta strand repeat-containing protein n=1 Tax=Vineibacter terrae TaxID=2586908 RepID=UPI0015B528A4|nr:filamentous hemagglutinin N-terminal domain-containing protein [Vineibacter terrae]